MHQFAPDELKSCTDLQIIKDISYDRVYDDDPGLNAGLDKRLLGIIRKINMGDSLSGTGTPGG